MPQSNELDPAFVQRLQTALNTRQHPAVDVKLEQQIFALELICEALHWQEARDYLKKISTVPEVEPSTTKPPLLKCVV